MTVTKMPIQYHKEQANLEWLDLSKFAVQSVKKNETIW